MPSDVTTAREVSASIQLALLAAAFLGALSGMVMALSAGMTTPLTPWLSRSPLTPTLIGLGLVFIAPALVQASHATWWEHIRVLAVPTALITVGLVAVSIIGPYFLKDADPTFGISVMWLTGLVPLAGSLVVGVLAQLRYPAYPVAPGARFPRWTTAPLALLASSYTGLGLGLVGTPRFWGSVLPWEVNDTDARALGVWCLGLGIGLLGALTDNDVARSVIGSRAMALVGLGQLVAYAVHATEVQWASWPGLSAVGLAVGLIFTGVTGQILYSMSGYSKESINDVITRANVAR